MGDTKRGRERTGKKKQEQRIEQEIFETLHADETPPDLDDPEPEIEARALENVSVSRSEDR